MVLCGKLMAKQVSTDGFLPLSKAQIKFYWDNGFLIIRNLFDVPTLNLFRDRFVEICNQSTNASMFCSVVKDPAFFKEGLSPELYIIMIQELLFDPVYMKYSENPRMLDIVSQLIGNDVTAVSSMLINKPPDTRDHPPHQDLFYFPFRPSDKIIGSWTAVDPVTDQNGCLFVIPTSHKAEILYNHCDKATQKQFNFGVQDEKSVAPRARRLHLTMEPGDTVFFHPCLVHGSGANNTKEYRKAMTTHYANSGCHYIDVKGTTQESVANLITEEMRRRGFEMDYAGLWRIKTKQVKGVRSQL